MSRKFADINRRWKAAKGASLIEAALLCSLLIAVAVPGIAQVGTSVKCRMQESAELFTGELEMPVQGEQTNSTMNLNSCRIRRPVHNRANPTPTPRIPSIG